MESSCDVKSEALLPLLAVQQIVKEHDLRLFNSTSSVYTRLEFEMTNTETTSRIVETLATFHGVGAGRWNITPRTGGWSVALVCEGCELHYMALLPRRPTHKEAFATLLAVLEILRDEPELVYVYDLGRLLDILVNETNRE